MYGHEPPTRLKIRDLELLDACPASDGPRSKMPTPQLDRWIAVADAIGEWYRQEPGAEDIGEIENQFMSWLDPVQRQIASRLFATYRQVMPKQDGEDVDTESSFSEVWDSELNATISAASQWAVTSGGVTERIKLKTGRSSTTDAEVAVLIEGCDEPDVTFTEVNVAAGTVEQLEMAETERQAVIARLFAVPSKVQGRRGTVPGLHCYRCARPARCGQYPALDPRLSGAESRAVMVSKKWLARLSQCERQVAWARLYGIPTDVGDEDEGGPSEMGIAFHRGIAGALISDDPDAVFHAYAETAPPSEQAELLQLWDNLKTLADTELHPVTIRGTEYGIGVTAHAPGPFVDSKGREHDSRLVAVVMAGFADAVGREADGTPAVIEFRTGGSGSLPLEPEIYALGTHHLTRKSSVAVHTHRIGNAEHLECDRKVFGESELVEAAEVLSAAAATVASWHPDNSLSPPYTVGEWCTWCEFAGRCADFQY